MFNFSDISINNITAQHINYVQRPPITLNYTISSQEPVSSRRAGQRILEANQAHHVQLAKDLHQQLETPHLILFLDINQTLLLGDIVQGKSAQDAVNDALTDLFFYQWDPNLPEMSYNEYVKEHLCPNTKKDPEIKKQQIQIISNFVKFLETSNHPLYPQVKEKYDHAIAALMKQDGMLFNSFYKMVDQLNQRNVPYTLIFRTFGGDGPEVVKELNRNLGENFVVYKEEIAKLNCESPEAFYEYCKTVKEREGRHIVIRDNWYVWNANGQAAAYGKPFPMDFRDRKYLPLFFDDNAYVTPGKAERNAVAPYDLENGKPIDPKDAIDKKRLFVVDPLDALHDPDYFVKHIDDALAYRRAEFALLPES